MEMSLQKKLLVTFATALLMAALGGIFLAVALSRFRAMLAPQN
jgi:hypothetical protein